MLSNRDIIKSLTEKDFVKQIKLTIGILFFYRFLSFLPLPGIDVSQALEWSKKLSTSGFNGFNLLSGGSMSRLSIMAIGISSYIMSSLIFTVLPNVHPYFASLKKDSSAGRAKLSEYTRYLALGLAFFKGWSLAMALEMIKDSKEIVMFPGFLFKFQAALIFACSAMIVMWFAEQISSRGLGNGSSYIIYTGIIAEMLPFTFKIFHMLYEKKITFLYFLIFIIAVFGILFLITFAERVYRLISAKNVSFKAKSFQVNSVLPESDIYIKLNPAGIYPSIFAQSLLGFPVIINNFLGISKYEYGAKLLAVLTPGSSYWFILFHALLIYLTSYIYAELNFNPEESAANFKNNLIIQGKKPGKTTKEYLEQVLFYVATIGGLYLVLVCCLPEFFISKSENSLYFSGTSMIIIVGVAVSFIDKVKGRIQQDYAAKSMKSIRKGYF